MPEAHTPALYTDEMAEVMKAHAGELYQPSNGDEGERFMGLWCELCSKDNLDHDTGIGGCPIIACTMALKVSDPDYPKAWKYGETGQPICTEFRKRQDGETRDEAAIQQKQSAYEALPRDPKTGRPIIP